MINPRNKARLTDILSQLNVLSLNMRLAELLKEHVLLLIWVVALSWSQDALAGVPPVCVASTETTGENTRFDFNLDCTDADNDIDTVQIVSGVSHGTLSAVDNQGFGYFSSYTPASDYSGSDAFTFEAVDLEGNHSSVVTGNITVVPEPDGGFTSLSGTAGCFLGFTVNAGGPICTAVGRGLVGLTKGVFSPDGSSLYVIGTSYHTVAALSRNTTTGALSQVNNNSSCFSNNGTAESGGLPNICTAYSTLNGVKSIVVSPDGKNLYVANENSHAIVIFDRNTLTGALTNHRCVSADGNDGDGNPTCATGGDSLVSVSSLAISPDGAYLYAASPGNFLAVLDSSILVLSRNSTTGNLTATSCFNQTGSPACTTTGIHDFGSVHTIILSPDGANLYALSYAGILNVFNRNSSTGALSQVAGTSGCVGPSTTPGCTTVRGTATAVDFAISADGLNVYGATDLSSNMFILSRDANTGLLSQSAGTDGCINDGGASGCADNNISSGIPFAGFSSVSTDPLDKFVSAASDDGGVNRYAHIFSRGTAGALTRLTLPYGCMTAGGSCLTNPLSAPIQKVLFSPDGLFAYALPISGDGIFGYGRNFVPTCSAATATVLHGRSVEIPLTCSDTNGDIVSRVVVTAPSHGTVESIDQSSGVLTYSASASYTGSDSIIFAGSDGTSGAGQAISITITNTAPACENVTASSTGTESATVTLSCTDADGDTLNYSLLSDPTSGTVGTIDQSLGSFSYTPSQAGTFLLSYTASDGVEAAPTKTVSTTFSLASPRLTLKQRNTQRGCGKSRNPCVGDSSKLSFRGRVRDSSYLPTQQVTVNLYFFKNGKWKEIKSKTVSIESNGKFTARFKRQSDRPGLWAVRARTPRSDFNRPARSARRYFLIA